MKKRTTLTARAHYSGEIRTHDLCHSIPVSYQLDPLDCLVASVGRPSPPQHGSDAGIINNSIHECVAHYFDMDSYFVRSPPHTPTSVGDVCDRSTSVRTYIRVLYIRTRTHNTYTRSIKLLTNQMICEKL